MSVDMMISEIDAEFIFSQKALTISIMPLLSLVVQELYSSLDIDDF